MSFLAIAFHNQAVEQEFLHRKPEALASYRQACTLADKCWGSRSSMASALRNNLKAFQKDKSGNRDDRRDHTRRPSSSRAEVSSSAPAVVTAAPRKRPVTASGAVSHAAMRQHPTYTVHSQRSVYEKKRRPKTAQPANRASSAHRVQPTPSTPRTVYDAAVRAYGPKPLPTNLRPSSGRSTSRSPYRASQRSSSPS
eukprot:3582014-Pyramimonas_sp.AAC.1